MKREYQAKSIEQDAQAFWDKKQSFKVSEDLGKEKFYCLSMFPYPSGDLHMGHVRNYTIGDVVSRYQRMLGKNVLQPIGWDAFGLPAENAAIKHKTHPAKWTRENIARMREQLKSLGYAYDWSRELATCEPDYYRWEQWFFVKLFEKGLVYKKNAIVNWDPVDETVLANEQVVDGRGWRSGALVERREIPQWFLKITDYADELLAGLDTLDGWPEQVRTMQRNWIGRSQGCNIDFDVPNYDAGLKVYTTRVDTFLGCTYLGIAPEHPLAKLAAEKDNAIAQFIEDCGHNAVAEAEMATMEKRGIATPFTAIHPITGRELPVWIANFVLMEYGSGAVMAVPAHDERDFEFAQKYNLAIDPVIAPNDGSDWDFSAAAFTAHGKLVNSGEFDGLSSEQALETLCQHLADRKKGEAKVNYRLRDWGISRQRYWGTPIPIIHCPDCGSVPVPEADLPVVLPEEVNFTGATSPLTQLSDFIDVACPKCGGASKRETDTFDTFMESSWYYARFTCKSQDKAMLDGRANYWTPVDFYIGGIEHAVMHLLYARFVHKLMRDLNLLNSDEPFTQLLTQGMVLKDGSKMSKSKGNTVDPTNLIEQYGADTVRLFTMFASPPEQSLEWADSGVDGAHRFLKRIWDFAESYDAIKVLNKNGKPSTDWDNISDDIRQLRRDIHQVLKQALYDYERSQFNTVVSGCMKIINILSKLDVKEAGSDEAQLAQEALSIVLRLLAPITPHICHELWYSSGYPGLILDAPWPKVAKEALKTNVVEYVVQVNGKLRAHIQLAAGLDNNDIEQSILADERILKYTDGKEVRKFIIIPKRQLINVVIAP